MFCLGKMGKYMFSILKNQVKGFASVTQSWSLGGSTPGLSNVQSVSRGKRLDGRASRTFGQKQILEHNSDYVSTL